MGKTPTALKSFILPWNNLADRSFGRIIIHLNLATGKMRKSIFMGEADAR